MIIKTRRQYTTNLRLFLDTLGIENYLYRIHDSTDELLVEDTKRGEFLERIRDYVHSYGYVPYHFCLSFQDLSNRFTEDSVRAEVKLVSITDFESVSGKFQLLQFENNEYNFLWKSYTIKEPAPISSITGRMKAVIKGINGETVNLISNVRMK